MPRELSVYVPGEPKPLIMQEMACGLCGATVIRQVNGDGGVWPCAPCYETITKVVSLPVDG